MRSYVIVNDKEDFLQDYDPPFGIRWTKESQKAFKTRNLEKAEEIADDLTCQMLKVKVIRDYGLQTEMVVWDSTYGDTTGD